MKSPIVVFVLVVVAAVGVGLVLRVLKTQRA